MNLPRLHIIITGSTGYISRRLRERALAEGWWITVLSRTPLEDETDSHIRWFHWDFGEDPPLAAFAADQRFPDPIATFHLAHRWHTAKEEGDINFLATRDLLEVARKAGIRRFVMASTASAREDALNFYGRSKWAIEQLLDRPGEISARIGLIYGGPAVSQWGTLCRIVRLSPILPMADAGRLIQPIHLDDLCEGLLRMASADALSRRVFGLADPRAIPFGRFLSLVAREVFGRRLLVVSIPSSLVLRVVDGLEHMGVRAPFDKERLLGLAGIRVIDTADDIAEIGLELRELVSGLGGSAKNRIRRLLGEGKVVLRYLLGKKPATEMLRRYVRGVSRFGDGRPLDLPAPVRWWPPLLRAFEPLGRGKVATDDLRPRLDIAVRLLEVSPQGAPLLYHSTSEGRVIAVLRLALILAAEGALLPVRFVLGVWFR